MTYFIFADEAARDFNRIVDWVKRFIETIYPVNVEPVFTEHRLIDSTDSVVVLF